MEPIDSTRVTEKFVDVVDQAIRKIERIHGGHRIERTIEPRLSNIRCSSSISLVMGNLLDNAIRASQKSDPVRVFATLREDFIHTEVIDRGCGIPPNVLARVCQYGFTSREDGDGFGIGLHIASEILSEVGGELSFDSELGEGTRAMARIPRL